MRAIVIKPVALKLPGTDRVDVTRDIPYSHHGGELRFDLYRPAGNGAAPAVVMIHGGPLGARLATDPKDWRIYQDLGRLIAASGLAGVAFNHRFYGFTDIAQAAGDVRELLAHLTANAAALKISADRLALWAFSGGGVVLSQFLADLPENIRAVAANYAALDASVKEFSASAQVSAATKPIPPLCVVRSGLDQPQLNATIDAFVAAALAKGAPLELYNHESGHHGFEIEDDNDRTRYVLKRTLDFFANHLGA